MVRGLPEPPATAIDVGCATGDFTYLLATGVPTLTAVLGVDFDDHAVGRARVRYPTIPFVRESLLAVGDRYPCRFDVAACLEVLYYLDRADRHHALASLRRLLRPRAHVVFSSYISGPPHFTPGEFCTLIETTFDVVATEVLHLRLVSLVERVVSHADRHLRRVLGHRPGSPAPLLGRLPLRAVSAADACSGRLTHRTASHTLVLARTRD